jgi:hypothetical protein
MDYTDFLVNIDLLDGKTLLGYHPTPNPFHIDGFLAIYNQDNDNIFDKENNMSIKVIPVKLIKEINFYKE